MYSFLVLKCLDVCVCCISMLCPFIRVCVGVCWRVLVCVSVNVFL